MADYRGEVSAVLWICADSRLFTSSESTTLRGGRKNRRYFKKCPKMDTDTFRSTFIERIGSIYKGKRNFYALAYDRDEVIDAVRAMVLAELTVRGCAETTRALSTTDATRTSKCASTARSATATTSTKWACGPSGPSRLAKR